VKKAIFLELDHATLFDVPALGSARIPEHARCMACKQMVRLELYGRDFGQVRIHYRFHPLKDRAVQCHGFWEDHSDRAVVV